MAQQEPVSDETTAVPVPPPRRAGRPQRPPHQITPWPATSDEVIALREDFQQFRQGLIGSKDFPGGEVLVLKNLIAAAAQNAAIASASATSAANTAVRTAADASQATAHLQQRVDEMPDIIVAKINGTYVKDNDFIPRVDARIKARTGEGRLAMLSTTTRWFLTVLTFTAVGIITYFVTNVLPHIH